MGKNNDYLEEERKKLWEAVENLRSQAKDVEKQLITLKEEVKNKTSDYESNAKNCARQAQSNSTRTSTLLHEVKEKKAEIDSYYDEVQQIKNTLPEINKLYETIKNNHDESEVSKNSLQKNLEEIQQVQNQIYENIDTAKEYLDQTGELHEQINEINISIKDTQNKITSAHNLAVNKNLEIKNAYDEIFGYTTEDKESGVDKRVPGTKEELEEAYDDLNIKIIEFSNQLDEYKKNSENKYDDFLSRRNLETEELKNRIRSLLPEAMTAGLSHAYEKKRITEESELEKSRERFRMAILWLSISAIIPIVVSATFMFMGKTFQETIFDAPRVVSMILPIYMPLFWLAISANRSVKLSKRLIEEYSHKESLSKTFEGLSKQISALDDDEVSKDLRTRLLYNIITASSENPGSLISDFHVSDNPILSVLDRSIKFSNSLDKLSSIPGIEFILQKVVKKQESTKSSIEKSVEKSFAVNDILEDEDEGGV